MMNPMSDTTAKEWSSAHVTEQADVYKAALKRYQDDSRRIGAQIDALKAELEASGRILDAAKANYLDARDDFNRVYGK